MFNDRDFENTSKIDYLKIMILHGRIFMLFSQVIFSILTRFQLAHIFFLISSRQSLKKQKSSFLFSVISSDVLLISFYVSLFIFDEIFYWIEWVTFRWIVVLFSFSFNSRKTSYLCKECKKELKKSCWFNNVCLQVISRLDLFVSKSICLWLY